MFVYSLREEEKSKLLNFSEELFEHIENTYQEFCEQLSEWGKK